MGFPQKPASTKLEVGFLSGILKVGFVEKYGLNKRQRGKYFGNKGACQSLNFKMVNI